MLDTTINVIVELENLIKKEEERVKNSFKYDGRFLIYELARAMDHFFIRTQLNNRSKELESDFIRFYCYGWPEALRIFYDDSVNQIGVPLEPSNDTLKDWANSVIQYCGKIGLLKQLIGLSKVGLVHIYKVNENSYETTICTKYAGVERVEVLDYFWLQDKLAESQTDEIVALNKRRKYINKIMSSLVFVWKKNFIGYDAHPEVDEYYHKIGNLLVKRLIGYDSFPPDVRFGRRRYGQFCSTIQFLIELSRKHVDFCFELWKKHRDIDIYNILVMFIEKKDLCEYLSEALNVELSVADVLLSTLTLSLENVAEYSSIPNGAPPPLIVIAGGMVLKFNIGCQNNPFMFLHRELRRKYPKDWDSAINEREKVFRNELYELFKCHNLLKVDRNIVLKEKGKFITDIDACLLDPVNGILGVFQLKWQDPFASSMRERASKKKNFIDDCTMWIDAVETWLEKRDYKEIAKLFGFRFNDMEKIKRVCFFVMGRNFAHFSGDTLPDSRAAWGGWAQVVRLFENNDYGSNEIAGLYDSLIKDSPFHKVSRIENEEILTLGDITVKSVVT